MEKSRAEYNRQWAARNYERLRKYRTEWARKKRMNNLEWARQKGAEYRENRKKRLGNDFWPIATLAQKRWRKKNPEKDYAYHRVFINLRNGNLKKSPCEVCGTNEWVEAHHTDYSKPLDVQWLCKIHHATADKLRRSKLLK